MERPTFEAVALAGFALFGREWKGPTARLLKVDDRSLRRMDAQRRAGETVEIPQHWATALRNQLAHTAAERTEQADAARQALARLR